MLLMKTFEEIVSETDLKRAIWVGGPIGGPIERAVLKQWLIQHPERCGFCLEFKHSDGTKICNYSHD
jgi:hypothetical protein